MSAGLLMFRRRPEGPQVLLVHPGGPHWAKKDDGVWSIPKGEVDPGEDLLATAKREFEEETGSAPAGQFIRLKPVRQKSGKVVHAWAVEGDLDTTAIRSNTCRLEWPPKSGKQIEIPEIDRAEFFDLATAKTKLNPAQVSLLDELMLLSASGLTQITTAPSRAEQHASGFLRTVLAPLAHGANIPESEGFRRVLGALESFIPEVLAQRYSEWKHESLDGIIPLVGRKTGDRAAEILGLCIIISDQTTTPIHLHLQVAAASNEISWLECKLGEDGKNGMLRVKWQQTATTKQLHALAGRADNIEWVHRVTFGKRT